MMPSSVTAWAWAPFSSIFMFTCSSSTDQVGRRVRVHGTS